MSHVKSVGEVEVGVKRLNKPELLSAAKGVGCCGCQVLGPSLQVCFVDWAGRQRESRYEITSCDSSGTRKSCLPVKLDR